MELGDDGLRARKFDKVIYGKWPEFVRKRPFRSLSLCSQLTQTRHKGWTARRKEGAQSGLVMLIIGCPLVPIMLYCFLP